jgi:prevent-host-death family protein
MAPQTRKPDWPVKRARARLLELIDRAVLDGPQSIWRNGKKAVVILSKQDFDRLIKSRSRLLS